MSLKREEDKVKKTKKDDKATFEETNFSRCTTFQFDARNFNLNYPFFFFLIQACFTHIILAALSSSQQFFACA